MSQVAFFARIGDKLLKMGMNCSIKETPDASPGIAPDMALIIFHLFYDKRSTVTTHGPEFDFIHYLFLILITINGQSLVKGYAP